MAPTSDMTVGSPTRRILLFALPLIGGNLLQQLYTVVDAVIVGRFLGVEALAAVGASWAVMFLIMGFCNGACAGFAIPVAQAFGAHDHTLMRRHVACSLRLAAIIALGFTAVTTLLCRHILLWVRTPADIMADAHTFFLFQLLSIPFIIAYNMLASLLRAVGNSQQPFYYLIMASMLNIVLAIVFIVFMGMGVAGVGLATMVSQAVAALACGAYIRRRATLLIPRRGEWRHDADETRHLLANGVPMGMQFSITGIGIIMLQTANNSLGTICVAAFTASMRVKYLFTCVFENIGAAMATYCGQNIGARRLDRVGRGIRAALLLSIAYFVVTALLIQPFADNMMSLFVESGNKAVTSKAAMLMRIACWFYPALGALTVLRYSIQGLGWSRLAVCSGIMEMFARGGVSLWLVPSIHYLGVCYGDPVAWLAADCFLIPAMTWLYFKGVPRQLARAER